MTITAKRLSDGEVEICGVTHCGTVPCGGNQFIGFATADHRWVVVRTAGLWVLADGGSTEFRTIPGSVAFHRIYRSEAAAYAEAQTIPGGRVIVVS